MGAACRALARDELSAEHETSRYLDALIDTAASPAPAALPAGSRP
jgi:hypothetical protein